MKRFCQLVAVALSLVSCVAHAQNAQPVTFDSTAVTDIVLETTATGAGEQLVSDPIDTTGYNAIVTEYKVSTGCEVANYTVQYKNSTGAFVGLNSANAYVEIAPANTEVRGGSYTIAPLMGVVYIQLGGVAVAGQICEASFRYKLATYSTAMQVTGHIPDVSHQWYPVVIGGKDSTGYNVEAARVVGGKLQVSGGGGGTSMAPKSPALVAVSTSPASVVVAAGACVSLSCNVDAYFESGATGGPDATTSSNDIYARTIRSFCFEESTVANYVSFVTSTGSGTCKVSEHLTSP